MKSPSLLHTTFHPPPYFPLLPFLSSPPSLASSFHQSIPLPKSNSPLSLPPTGGDNNLRVILSQYDPSDIRCYGRMSRPNILASCQEILDQMPAFNTPFEFGPSSDEGADVQLPKLLTSSRSSPSLPPASFPPLPVACMRGGR